MRSRPRSMRQAEVDAAITLKPLPPGQYVAVTRSAQLRTANTAWFTVSELGLISKQAAASLAIYAINLRTGGEPMPDVAVHVELSSTRGSRDLEQTDEGGTDETKHLLCPAHLELPPVLQLFQVNSTV